MKKIVIVLSLMFLLFGCAQTTGKIEKSTSSEEEQASKTSVATTSAGNEMRVHFIDVGQGDSIFIESPNGKTMLIDGGVKGAGKKVVNYLREQGVKKLDMVVATHPDSDHIGGLISVLNSISIKQVVDSGKVHTSQTFEEMLTLIDTKNIKYTVPKTGELLKFDDAVSLQVIHADETAEDNNDASIVLKLVYGDVSFLFTGDAGIAMEQKMLHENLHATVLKAGHHGSNTSSSEAFIRAVQPEVTILSYGEDNKYGHPHQEVVERLQGVGSKIYATAEAGNIVIATNGVTYKVMAQEMSGDKAASAKEFNEAGTMQIASKDLQTETVGIINTSTEPIALQGWKLISKEGNQQFEFPTITLQPGQTIYVTSGAGAKEGNGYIKWTNRQIWLNDGDAAQLLNVKGEIISEFE